MVAASTKEELEAQSDELNRRRLELKKDLLANNIDPSTSKEYLDLENRMNDIAGKLYGIYNAPEGNLLKTSDLRPLPWSKTVTLFDVYKTDEENFQPYISPLATIITTETGNTANTNTSGNSEENTGNTDPDKQIRETLLKYYDDTQVNSKIKSINNAKTGDEISEILKTMKMKQDKTGETSVVSIRHEIQKIKGMGY